ncbi:MAG: DUF5777 family beta-barrel protein [Chryseosolibacter sp.]
MMKFFLTGIFISVISCIGVRAQDDLMELIDKENAPVSVFTEQTFKGTRLINGHSIETRKKGVLDVIISHRFGRLNSGAYELFGLDESNVRLGVDYGISDRLNAGVGRNSFEKTFDGFLKYKFLRQQNSNGRNVPISVAGFSSIAVKTLRSTVPGEEPTFNSRLSYTYQAIFARKFTSSFSFQLVPTFVHRNEVLESADENSVYAFGAGGRIKLTKRLSFNAEYYYQLNRDNEAFPNSIAVGFDIETGGHVFQLHFTNSRSMIEKGFITETAGDFFDGDIHFGFNISRTFQLVE